jgi:pimeloyl-ACP methyl ester carboxylesterase
MMMLSFHNCFRENIVLTSFGNLSVWEENNAGHAVMIDQPDIFNQIIKEFVEDTI